MTGFIINLICTLFYIFCMFSLGLVIGTLMSDKDKKDFWLKIYEILKGFEK